MVAGSLLLGDGPSGAKAPCPMWVLLARLKSCFFKAAESGAEVRIVLVRFPARLESCFFEAVWPALEVSQVPESGPGTPAPAGRATADPSTRRCCGSLRMTGSLEASRMRR